MVADDSPPMVSSRSSTQIDMDEQTVARFTAKAKSSLNMIEDGYPKSGMMSYMTEMEYDDQKLYTCIGAKEFDISLFPHEVPEVSAIQLRVGDIQVLCLGRSAP